MQANGISPLTTLPYCLAPPATLLPVSSTTPPAGEKKTQTLLSSLKFLLKESCIVSRQTKSLLKITCIFSQGNVNPCWRRAMKTIRLQSNSGRITATKITFLSGILWLFFFFLVCLFLFKMMLKLNAPGSDTVFFLQPDESHLP